MRVADRGFFGSAEKAILREQYDLPLLRWYAGHCGHPLAYLGLPGPEIEDLIAWQEVIGESTGVERLRKGAARAQDLEIHRRLQAKVVVKGISNFQLLRGNIEDILLEGCDLDKKPPRCSHDHGTELRFNYDLVNLDFFGGVGHARRNRPAKRVDAIKKLLARQRDHDFILLLTVNVRDDLAEEMQEYIASLSGRSRDSESELLQRHLTNADGEKHLLLKAVVPAFVRNSAEENLLSCVTYPTVAYSGTNAYMLHFSFLLTSNPGVSFQAFSEQSLEQVLKLPLLRATSDTIALPAAEQIIGFDAEALTSLVWLQGVVSA